MLDELDRVALRAVAVRKSRYGVSIRVEVAYHANCRPLIAEATPLTLREITLWTRTFEAVKRIDGVDNANSDANRRSRGIGATLRERRTHGAAVEVNRATRGRTRVATRGGTSEGPISWSAGMPRLRPGLQRVKRQQTTAAATAHKIRLETFTQHPYTLF